MTEGRHTIVEGMMPDLLHVIPIGHNSMLNGVLDSQNITPGLGLIPHIVVSLFSFHSSMTGVTNN